MADLGIPIGTSRTVTASATQPVDTYRAGQP